MSDLHPIDGIKRYVVGFMFNTERNAVVLIEKNRPDWQKGKLNGVGGKIEPTDASEAHAMSREFFEETGVGLASEAWTLFAILKAPDAVIHVFKAFSSLARFAETRTDEKVYIEPLDRGNLYTWKEHVPNVPVLIRIALQPQIKLAELHY